MSVTTHWLGRLQERIEEACAVYEKTAPTAHAWLDDLYRRINERPEAVVLPELLFLDRLVEDGEWMHSSYVANAVYHLLHRLGRDTTGQAGF